jgi:hypothetical protein
MEAPNCAKCLHCTRCAADAFRQQEFSGTLGHFATASVVATDCAVRTVRANQRLEPCVKRPGSVTDHTSPVTGSVSRII